MSSIRFEKNDRKLTWKEFARMLMVLAVVVTALLKSTERVKVPLICSIISLLTSFSINYILIYGRLGAPKMGVAGAVQMHRVLQLAAKSAWTTLTGDIRMCY